MSNLFYRPQEFKNLFQKNHKLSFLMCSHIFSPHHIWSLSHLARDCDFLRWRCPTLQKKKFIKGNGNNNSLAGSNFLYCIVITARSVSRIYVFTVLLTNAHPLPVSQRKGALCLVPYALRLCIHCWYPRRKGQTRALARD